MNAFIEDKFGEWLKKYLFMILSKFIILFIYWILFIKYKYNKTIYLSLGNEFLLLDIKTRL